MTMKEKYDFKENEQNGKNLYSRKLFENNMVQDKKKYYVLEMFPILRESLIWDMLRIMLSGMW